MLKSYIAGKITGLNYEECLIKIEIAEKMLIQLGYEPVNPMKFIPRNIEWYEAMRRCIIKLMDCDVICMLDDYRESDGASLELTIANKLDFKILIQEREAKKTNFVISTN